MTDYYTQFCTAIPMSEEAAAFAMAVKNELEFIGSQGIQLQRGHISSTNAVRHSGLVAEVAQKIFDDCADTADCELSYDQDTKLLTVSADYAGNVDVISDILQETMKVHGLADPISFQWSASCSRPILDADGGGAVIITPDEIHKFDTDTWAENKLKEIAGEGNKEKPLLGIVVGDGCIQEIISDRPDEINIDKVVVINYDSDNDFEQNTIPIEQADGRIDQAYVQVYDTVAQAGFSLRSTIDKLKKFT